MKVFKVTQRKQACDCVTDLRETAYKMDMHSVILFAKDSISGDIVVRYSFFSDYSDAEQYMKQVTSEQNANDYKSLVKGQEAPAWVVYFNDAIYSNNVEFGWVDVVVNVIND